jgi:hypothetical protein
MDRKSFSIRRIGEFAVLDCQLKRNRGLLARFIYYAISATPDAMRLLLDEL